MEKIQIAGKQSILRDDLKYIESNTPFNRIELYTSEELLQQEETDTIVERLTESPIDVVSVHTPHVFSDNSAIETADYIADSLDATLVFHSQAIHYTPLEDHLSEVNPAATVAVENHPGHSVHHIEKAILDKGFNLTLDIAHLYSGEKNWREEAQYLLCEYGNQIKVVHFASSRGCDDGVTFEEGDISIRDSWELVENTYSGPVIIEVHQRKQVDVLERLSSITETEQYL